MKFQLKILSLVSNIGYKLSTFTYYNYYLTTIFQSGLVTKLGFRLLNNLSIIDVDFIVHKSRFSVL